MMYLLSERNHLQVKARYFICWYMLNFARVQGILLRAVVKRKRCSEDHFHSFMLILIRLQECTILPIA
jgi:hypothetical protein